jgi:glutaredoxin
MVEKEVIQDRLVFLKKNTINDLKQYLVKRKRNMKAVVWSKNQCPFCDQAKNLLKLKGIEFEERNVSKDWTKEQLLEAVPTARTVPQIFLDDKLIGGFTELRAHFQKV